MATSKSIRALLSCKELKELLQTSPKSVAILEADVGKQVEADFKAYAYP